MHGQLLKLFKPAVKRDRAGFYANSSAAWGLC